MEKGRLVSIITPTYNHEKFIDECIGSVLNQTYRNWEHIIVDDGSTDRTGEIIKRYGDERIVYIRLEKNLGIKNLSKIYNEALNRASGEIIAILEGDDCWPADKLEKQVEAFNKPNCVLCWGKARLINEQGVLPGAIPPEKRLFRHMSQPKAIKELIKSNFIPAVTVMCRKDALLYVGGFKQVDYTPYVDHPTWLELAMVGDICSSTEVLGYWRRHSNQVTRKMLEEMVLSTKYPFEFYGNLPPGIRKRIGLNEKTLRNIYQNKLASLKFHQGRVLLHTNDFAGARTYFLESFHRGTGWPKLKAIIGIVFTYLKIDFEWAARRSPAIR